MVWEPPPVGKRNGDIIYYKIFYVPSTVPSTREEQESTMVKIEDVSNTAEFVIDELKKWTEYRVWMLAGTIVGDGPSSYPVLVRTGEDGMPLIFTQKKKLIIQSKDSCSFLHSIRFMAQYFKGKFYVIMYWQTFLVCITLISLLRGPYLSHLGSTSFVLPIRPKNRYS